MTPQEKARATRARNKERRRLFEEELARVECDQAKIDKKSAALQRLADDPGATPAERENARQKAEVVRRKKPDPHKSFNSMPATPEEFAALFKKPPPSRKRKTAPEPPKRPASLAIAHAASADWSKDTEITQLKLKIARLEKELARLKQPTKSGKPGRKPLGDRAMTAAERMRNMRLRNCGAIT
jgi:hypothetical protein